MDFVPPPGAAPEAVMFLSPLAVALAACMLLVGGAVSMQLNLALHTQLFVAGIRMVLQMVAVCLIQPEHVATVNVSSENFGLIPIPRHTLLQSAQKCFWGILYEVTFGLPHHFNSHIKLPSLPYSLTRVTKIPPATTPHLPTHAQLLALGYILVPIFAYNQAWLVLAYALFMLSVATSEASARSQYTYTGVFMHTLASMALSAGAMLTYTVLVVLARHPWWDAQYVIPILGMILGNATSGISVGLSAVLEEMASGKDLIEYKLALGADRSEATRELVSKGVRLAMLPVLNMMSVMGLVSIPGMMTGQILSGADPDIAARYQMMIVFVIAGTTSLAALISVRLAVNSIVDRHHCFRPELLTKRSKVTIFSRATDWLSALLVSMWSAVRSLCCCCCCCCCCPGSADIEAPVYSSVPATPTGPDLKRSAAVSATGVAPGLPRVGGAVDRKSKGNSDNLLRPLLQDTHDATSGDDTSQPAYTSPIISSLHAAVTTPATQSQQDGSSSSQNKSVEHREPHQIKAMHPAFMAPVPGAAATSGPHSIAAAAAPSIKQALEHNTCSTSSAGHCILEPTLPATHETSLFHSLQTAAISHTHELQASAQSAAGMVTEGQPTSVAAAILESCSSFIPASSVAANIFTPGNATAASLTEQREHPIERESAASVHADQLTTTGQATVNTTSYIPGLAAAARAAPVLAPAQVLLAECLIPVVILAAAHRQPLSEPIPASVQASSLTSQNESATLTSAPISSPPVTVTGAVAEVLTVIMQQAPVVIESMSSRAAVPEVPPTVAATTNTGPTPPMASPISAGVKPGPLKPAASGGKGKGKGKKK